MARSIAFALRAPVSRDDLPGLCERVCTLLHENRPQVAWCDVAGVAADAVAVDGLARLQLAARRYGCRVHLLNASDELAALVDLMGLADALAVEPGR
jgi:ABC-type transporter Mla MlaB component